MKTQAVLGAEAAAAQETGGNEMILIARVYDPRLEGSGVRYLVERLWPRGMKKEALRLDGWLKDAAPSAALRRWFGHKSERWNEFQKRYMAELRANPDGWKPILTMGRRGNVTLLYSARDTERNGAVVLQTFVSARLRRHAVETSR
jgi:uncharacterized protein YeaO (DUF488 family)